jgi:DNA ligase 4
VSFIFYVVLCSSSCVVQNTKYKDYRMEETSIPPEVTEELLLKGEVNCGTLLFKDFCSKLTKIEKLRTCNEKMSLLFNEGLRGMLKNESVKQSIFPLLRLMIPINDGTRKKYGLKQATVATTYIDALHLNPASADAQRLKFWKNPSKLSSDIAKKTSGELGEVLQDVLKLRISVENSTFTISDVNNILDELAATTGESQTAVIRRKILNVFSPVEQKWLMRIVFQDMKIGLKYENVLKWLHPNALQRYNECTDLRQLCSELANGCLTSSADHEGVVLSRGISLFTCFQPMLAKGFTNSGQINEVESAMKKHPFIMDLKLDGERMLCHVSKKSGEEGKGMFWSRNGSDYSTTYRSLLEDVIENVQCESCVLDGEVCAWDDSTQRFIPFGHNRTVARYEQESQRENPQSKVSSNSSGSGGSMRLVYVLFDVLYLEGLRDSNGRILHRDQWRSVTDCQKTIPGGLQALQAEDAKEACRSAHARRSSSSSAGDILHMPLLARRALLAQAIQLVPNRIQAVRCVSVYTSNVPDRKRQIESFFNQVSTEGEEGLVVKDLLSPYSLGMKSRQLMHWVKMKPEYSDMTRDLDLIILGAYFGEGKSMRGQGLSTFLCGVRDSSSASSSADGDSDLSDIKYKSICKVGTGYSFTELEDLRSRLAPIAQPWDKTNRQYLPPHFCPWRIGKTEDIPDVWVPPERSIVIELKCAELVTSTQFSAGITCRFPRLRKIRYDKDVCEVMTIDDVKDVLERPRMNVAEAALRGITGAKKKKRAANSGTKPRGGLFQHAGHLVPEKFLVPKPTGQQQKMDSVIFQGKVFCIVEGSFTLQTNDFFTKGNTQTSLLKYATKKNRYKMTRLQVRARHATSCFP